MCIRLLLDIVPRISPDRSRKAVVLGDEEILIIHTQRWNAKSPGIQLEETTTSNEKPGKSSS